MKRIFALLLLAFMLMCFTGCKENSGDSPDTSNAPEVTIDPVNIDWGFDEEKLEYDRWYLQNSDDVTYIFFSDDEADLDKNSICNYFFVKSGVVSEAVPLKLTDNNHLTGSNGELSVDLVFKDSFNAYDYNSGSYYSRGNIDDYNSYFAGKVYKTENSKDTIAFNSDFSCTKTDSKKEFSGTWEVVSKHGLKCSFPEDESVFNITYNDDMSVKSISCKGEVYYNEINEDETVNKYKAY